MSSITKLTIIIPFLNEGYEVRNTLASIREYAKERVDIIVINDASDELYDYEKMVQVYDVSYIKNEERKGVAASRNLGVNLSTTPYFLLLDSHMRFYDDAWIDAIVNRLEDNDRKLLCCQTKVLRKEGGDIVVCNQNNAYGANILFDNTSEMLDIRWNKQEKDSNSDIEIIPCVYGAAYACSKRYWTYLRGLDGLMNYGSDEAYISLKVWQEGGVCELLKKIEVGHIFRDRFPYKISSVDSVYNKLLIAELLLPDFLKKRFLSICKNQFGVVNDEACKRLMANQAIIDELKDYYQLILNEDFTAILQMNDIAQNID